MWNQVQNSDSSNEVYDISNNNNRNNIINNNSFGDSKNRNMNISDSKNNKIVTNHVVNRPIGKNCVNIGNFLNNECLNICDVVPFI